jgi:hypothetical protein
MEETTRYRNHTIKIWQDEDAQNPREWSDHLGTMVFFHKRYCLGDTDHGVNLQVDSWDKVERNIRRKFKGTVLLMTVYMFDHSGVTIRVDPEPFRQADSTGWDWGQIGYIFTTRLRIREWYQKKLISKKTMAKAEKHLLHEIEEYDQYLRGDVYGYTIEDKNGNVIDSCGNYYGEEYIMHDAKSAVDCAIDGPRKGGNRSHERQQKAKSQLRDAHGRFIKKVA